LSERTCGRALAVVAARIGRPKSGPARRSRAARMSAQSARREAQSAVSLRCGACAQRDAERCGQSALVVRALAVVAAQIGRPKSDPARRSRAARGLSRAQCSITATGAGGVCGSQSPVGTERTMDMRCRGLG
jgi:hypothetical protein